MKHLVLCATVAIASTVAFAQEATSPATGNTTASAQRATTASAAMANNFTQEAFEKRWKLEESMYKEAGISDDKITKLYEINQTLWKARASGEKIDFPALSRQRSEILTQDDMKKLMEVRRNMVNKRLGSNNSATTATQ